MFSQNVSSRQVSRFSVAIVGAIYASDWYVYHFICHPDRVAAIFFNIAFVMAVASYLRAACTDPGTPESPEWEEWHASHDPSDWDIATKKRGWSPGDTTKCDICHKLRPERAHHCNVCGVCVLRMDHHCPWIGNCVGWRNHKFFILLTWWSLISCVLWLATLNGPNAFESLDALTSSQENLLPLVFVILTVLLLFVTGGMAVYSVSQAAKNITSVEQLFHGENPYSYRTSSENLEQLLGPIDFWLVLPVFPASRSNGSTFPIVGDFKPQPKPSQELSSGAPRSEFVGRRDLGYGATNVGLLKPLSPRSRERLTRLSPRSRMTSMGEGTVNVNLLTTGQKTRPGEALDESQAAPGRSGPNGV